MQLGIMHIMCRARYMSVLTLIPTTLHLAMPCVLYLVTHSQSGKQRITCWEIFEVCE